MLRSKRKFFVAVLAGVELAFLLFGFALPAVASTKVTKPGIDSLDVNCLQSEDDIYDCYDDSGAKTACVSTFNKIGDFIVPGTAAAVAQNCVKTCEAQVKLSTSFTDAAATCARCMTYFAKPEFRPLNMVVNAIGAGGTLYMCTSEGKAALKRQFCDKGPHNCCIEDVQGGEEYNLKAETCVSGLREDKYYTGKCFCLINGVDDPNAVGDVMSPKSCEDTCKEKGGRASTNRGVGRYAAIQQAQGGDAKQEYIDSTCFTQDECADPKYGGTTQAFVPYALCPTGKGRCLAPEPEIKLSYPIMGIDTVKGLKNYIVLAFKYLLSIVVITAAVMFVYGGFKYILGATAGSVESAKETMVNAVIGMVVTIGATALLNTINPNVTNLNRLDIYLLKTVNYSNFNWCTEYKAESGSIKFADAGNPPGSASYNGAKFTVTADQTACGVQYYPDGFGGKTCNGQKCDTGKVCVTCKDATRIKECADNPNGFTCAKATIGGTITWKDGKYPVHVWLIPVCNKIQPAMDAPFDWSIIEKNTPDRIEGKLDVGTTDSGTGAYAIVVTQADLDKIGEDCSKNQLTRGFLIGVQYHDASGLGTATRKAFYAAMKNRLGSIEKHGAIYNLSIANVDAALTTIGTFAAGVTEADDAAIVAKWNCDNSAYKAGGGTYSMFAGYADGTRFASTAADLTTAMYCGYSIRPGDDLDPRTFPSKYQTEAFANSSGIFHKLNDDDPNDPYFSYTNIKNAVGGGNSVQCNLSFNKEVSPSDPASMYLGCCQQGSHWSDMKWSDDGTLHAWCNDQ